MDLLKMIDLKKFFKSVQLNKLNKFKQKINMKIERGHYIIKTAENKDELLKILQLRYAVFYEELLNKKLSLMLDFDSYDLVSDHLCIIDKRTNILVGTYRFISSNFSDKFYSSSEFNIKSILKLPGNKLELGRACVHKDFRNGVIIALLWQGIMEYSKINNIRYIFGCSSVKTMDYKEIAFLSNYLQQHSFSDKTDIKVKGKFKINHKKLSKHLVANNDFNVSNLIPPLLKGYLGAGAKVYTNPALDKSFKCVDYFTLLDIEKLNKNKIREREERCLSKKAVS